MSLDNRITQVESSLHKVEANQESLASSVEKVNDKLDKLTEIVTNIKAFEVELTHFKYRLEQSEKSRWWLIATVVGAVIAAIMKEVLYK